MACRCSEALKVELLLCRWIERSRADLELREVVGEKKRKEISLVLARKKKARQQKVRKRKQETDILVG
jgi:hypothetical protein